MTEIGHRSSFGIILVLFILLAIIFNNRCCGVF